MVANRLGIPIKQITLWLFGGVAQMSKDTDSPGTEFKIAAAGPAVTLVLAIAFWAVGLAVAGAGRVLRRGPARVRRRRLRACSR